MGILQGLNKHIQSLLIVSQDLLILNRKRILGLLTVNQRKLIVDQRLKVDQLIASLQAKVIIGVEVHHVARVVVVEENNIYFKDLI